MIFGTIDTQGIVTKNLEVDLDSLPSEDPIAFGYGIHRGQIHNKEASARQSIRIHYTSDISIRTHGTSYRELSQEYLRGFLLGYIGILVPEGTKIKKGEELCYALQHLNILKR